VCSVSLVGLRRAPPFAVEAKGAVAAGVGLRPRALHRQESARGAESGETFEDLVDSAFHANQNVRGVAECRGIK